MSAHGSNEGTYRGPGLDVQHHVVEHAPRKG
jgi:hypothetical protein